MNDLYRDAAEAGTEAASGFSFDDEVLKKALKNIYSKKFHPMTDIEENLFNEICKTFNEATDKGFGARKPADPDYDFYQEIRHNNAVFSAFKVHRAQNDMAANLLDAEGKLKPFAQWAKDVQPIATHQVEDWLQTEYDMAIKRAHQAADWKQFEREKDVLPNLEWVSSEGLSIEPGADHKAFWGTILPLDHPFWKSHKPKDRWGCNCSLRATDKPCTPKEGIPSGGNDDKPADGLDGNPGQTGEIFSESHPYIENAYLGAEKAVGKFIDKLEHEDTSRTKRKIKTKEQKENIQKDWKKRKDINRKVQKWASIVDNKEFRQYAEDAARKIMELGLDLPDIRCEDLGKKTKRGLTLANFSETSNTITLNKNHAISKEGGIRKIGQEGVEYGWSSQKNPVLHELSHYVHSQIDPAYSGRSLNRIDLDRKIIEKQLSEYACANKAEYEAELISGILSGKRYSDTILRESFFCTQKDKNDIAEKLFKKGRDNSRIAIAEREKIAKEGRESLVKWYKDKLPEVKIGKFMGKRLEVETMQGNTVFINKNFYNEVVTHYKDDIYYPERLEMSKRAHKWMESARMVRKETSEHHPGEVFRVYEYSCDDIVYELKTRQNRDGDFLYYMKRK